MADIFVSYARADKARVAPLVAALEAQGWSVWWDPEITPGQEFDEQIIREIEAARAVIVVWTAASVASRWVRGEARLAADRGTLVPVRFDAASLPLDVRAIHTTDLDDWKEDVHSNAFQELLRALGPLLKAAAARSASETFAPSERRGVSICVLPFANMSSDAEQEYFSDGISEDIITDLSKVSALAVISRNSAFIFKGKDVDLRQVARQLEVTHVLEGSVRKSGNRVRITAQLIEAARDTHVWAERYDRDLSDIFALQDEISQAIVKALKLTLFPEEKKAIEDRGTTQVEAYDKYLRARGLLHQRGASQLQRAIEIYREALALDPGFIPAWCGLYDAHRDAILYAAESTEAASNGMTAAAARILALAPDAWSSHALRAEQFKQQHEWLEAEAAASAALAAAPASKVDAVWIYATVLFGVGRAKESVAVFRRVLQADPLSLRVSTLTQFVLDCSGHSAEAEAEYERSKDLPGDRDMAEHLALFRALGRGDVAAAKEQVRRFMANQSVSVAGLEDLPEIFDQPATMHARLNPVQADAANQDFTRQTKISLWAAWHGDAAVTAAALRRLVNAPVTGMIWHPVLSETRRTPAFKEIVRDLGLVDYWRKGGQWGDFARPLADDDFEIIK